MGWLKDGIVEYLLSIYASFFSSINGLLDLANKTPVDWMDGLLWNAVNEFNRNAILPIAYSLLTLFLLLELVNILQRNDAKGMDSIYWVGTVILKIAICKALIDNMDLIIQIIFELTSFAITNGKQFISTSGDISIDASDIAALEAGFEGIGIPTLLGSFLSGFILDFVQKICFLIARVLIMLRFVEIYAITAIGSLAFSTFPSKEYSSIGKNFIKTMVALNLHVILISVILFMYMIIISAEVFVAQASDPLGTLFNGLAYTILLIIALFKSESWAKKFVGAN